MTEQLKIQARQGTTVVAISSLLVGIVAVSCAAIFVKISLAEIGPIATISNRFWIAIVPFSVWAGGERLLQPETPSAPLQPDEWALLLLAGVIAAVDLPLWAFSLSRTSVANAMVLSDLAPLFTTLGAWLLWRQQFDPRFLVGLAVSLMGCLLYTSPSPRDLSTSRMPSSA